MQNNMQELAYLLNLQQQILTQYEKMQATTRDVQLQDFLEVINRHRKALIEELTAKINLPVQATNAISLNSILLALEELNDTFNKGNTHQIARKIAEIEKSLIDRYKEAQKKEIASDEQELLKKQTMTVEEFFLQADVLARLI